jgi:hypothetical protein
MTVLSRVDAIIKDDDYLKPFQETMEYRVKCSDDWIAKINESEGGVDAFTRGYEMFGFIITPEGIRYREWAPGVIEAYLIGDFSKLKVLTLDRRLGPTFAQDEQERVRCLGDLPTE